jgi:peptide methionine sulfoxide reductase msrA/msrB
MDRYHSLSSEEENIICHSGTEAPNSGEYNRFVRSGVFICKRCDTRYIFLKANFLQDVDGQVLMKRFQVLSKKSQI